MDKKQMLLDFIGANNSDIIVEKVYIQLFEQFPNLYTISFAIDLDSIIKRLKRKYELADKDFIIKTEEACRDNWNKVNYSSSAYLIQLPGKILLNISSTKAEIYYSKDTDFKSVKDVISTLKTRKKKKNVDTRSFYLLKTEGSDFSLRKIEAKKVNLDLNLFYNDDFLPFHEKLSAFLEDDKQSGLALIHGKQGTGKTAYLKHLIFNSEHKFILVPRNLFTALDNPNLFFYLKEFKEFVLVLEDCDVLLTGSGKYNSLMGFLRNAEGLMSNDFVYKIICTASVSGHQINFNYLRKARNVYRYEMTGLSVEKANRLREIYQVQQEIKRPVVLEDVINPLSEFREKKLGFKW